MSTSRRISGAVDEAPREKLLLERLQILVERLRWSYAALWTLNPHSRVLQWKTGHFSSQPVEASKAASSQPNRVTWYAQQFYTKYRSCSFTPGIGFVGRANLEGRDIWLSGDSVCQNAGSQEQLQFLSYSKIKTVMCIPLLDNVLELGTTDSVGENFQLMHQIQQVMAHDLLSVPPLHEGDENVNNVAGFAPRLDKTSPSATATAVRQQATHDSSIADPLPLPHPVPAPTSGRFQSPFDINLSDQVWRSDMIFNMQEQDNLPALAAAWRSISHGLMSSVQSTDRYRPRTNSLAGTAHDAAATTSSSASVSSHGDYQYSYSFSARPAATSMSPELLHHNIMPGCLSPPISLFTAPDRTSSTVRLPQGQPNLQDAAFMLKHHDQLHATAASNQNNSLRRTSSCSNQYEVREALSLLEAQEMAGHDQWRQQCKLNPVRSESADPKMDTVSLHTWHPGGSSTQPDDMNVLAKQEFQFPRARQLQRRHTLPAMEVLKEVETFQQEAANSSMVDTISSDQPAAPGPSHIHVQVNTPHWRGRPRATNSITNVAAAHDEAALNHMLAERRRRVKQKENFATLRRLVPIISKADKASTLVDAIVYLKDLQNTIEELKAKKDDMVQRCKDLARKCVHLEEQNKELEAILSQDKPPTDGGVHLNHLRLHSMKSI